jgi:hypothetical protein
MKLLAIVPIVLAHVTVLATASPSPQNRVPEALRERYCYGECFPINVSGVKCDPGYVRCNPPPHSPPGLLPMFLTYPFVPTHGLSILRGGLLLLVLA